METKNLYTSGNNNACNIYPDFVYLISKRGDTYYLQHSVNNIIVSFRETSKERINKIHFFDTTCNKVPDIKNKYLIGDEPIFAFQINKKNIFISNINNFITFIKKFET